MKETNLEQVNREYLEGTKKQEEFLKEKNFERIIWHKFEEEDKFYKAFLAKEEQEFFFKAIIEEKTEIVNLLDNEIKWLKIFSQLKDAPFEVPELIDFKEREWFLVKKFEQPSLADLKEKDIKPWLSLVIDSLFFLKEIQNSPFFGELKPTQTKDFKLHFEKSIDEHSEICLKKKILSKQDIDELRKIIIQPEYFESSFAHGAFEPKHLFCLKKFSKLGLIDLEHMHFSGFQWGDAAQFYNLLIVKHEKPETAKEFLKNLYKKFLQKEKRKFEKQFLIFNAERIIRRAEKHVLTGQFSSAVIKELKNKILKGFPALLE